jgi:2-polyprenyl-6-hydroxyphenyl methylase/3-demethylubiquinone-9 3-methyltransferase
MSAAEALADERPSAFDLVTCMELLEHVPDPASMVAACAGLVRPGGTVVCSTINRNPKSYLFAIVGAEYVLRLLPRGTHDYALAEACRDRRFRPSRKARSRGPIGMTYARSRGPTDSSPTRGQYIATFRRDA